MLAGAKLQGIVRRRRIVREYAKGGAVNQIYSKLSINNLKCVTKFLIGSLLTITLKLDDSMNRQLTAEICDNDAASDLVAELIHHGLISAVCPSTQYRIIFQICGK